MSDTYMINGEPVARYEQEQYDAAVAVLARFADPETLAGNLSISVEDQVKDRITAGARYPHVALTKLQAMYSRWARDDEAKNAFPNWRVTLDINSPEVSPGWGIDGDGLTIPRILFLPLDPDGSLARTTGAQFAAVYHHSMGTYSFEDQNGRTVVLQDGLSGYHGIVRTYPTLESAESDATELANAVRTLRKEADSPYTDDPVRQVREYTKPEPLTP